MVYPEYPTLGELCEDILSGVVVDGKTAQQYEARIRNIAQMMYDGRKAGGRKEPATANWKTVNAYEFFDQKERIKKLILDNYTVNATVTGFWTAFKSVIDKFELVKNNGLSIETLKFYDNLMAGGSRKHEENKLKNLGNKASFVLYNGKMLTWDVIKKKCDEYFDDSPESNWNESVNRVITLLYTDMPPRRLEDYKEMVLYDNHKDYEASVEYNKAEIDVQNNQVILRIGRYKNWKKYGAFQTILGKKYASRLANAIIDSYKHFPRRYLICKSTKDVKAPIDVPNPQMSGLVSKLFNFIVRGTEKAEKGQNISANILRHNYITWWYKKNPNPSGEKMLELAKKMGHSVSMSQGYRMLDDDEQADIETDDEEEDIPIAQRKTTAKLQKGKQKVEEVAPPSTPEKVSEVKQVKKKIVYVIKKENGEVVRQVKGEKKTPPKVEKTTEKTVLRKRPKKPESVKSEKDTNIEYTKRSLRKLNLDMLISKYQKELKEEHELVKELEMLEERKKQIEEKRKAVNEKIDMFEDVIAGLHDKTSKPKKD